MRRSTEGILGRNLLVFLALIGCLHAQSLKQIASIDLPGPKGERFDYLTLDDEDHYLLSAHLGPGILYVIDVRTNKLVKAIPPGYKANAIEWVNGHWAGGADPRSEGAAVSQ